MMARLTQFRCQVGTRDLGVLPDSCRPGHVHDFAHFSFLCFLPLRFLVKFWRNSNLAQNKLKQPEGQGQQEGQEPEGERDLHSQETQPHSTHQNLTLGNHSGAAPHPPELPCWGSSPSPELPHPHSDLALATRPAAPSDSPLRWPTLAWRSLAPSPLCS